MKNVTVNLGNEYDMRLWEALKSVLQKLGGRLREQKWGVVGSQELESFDLMLEGSVIHIESETYIGITLSGDPTLVRKIQRLVDDRMAQA